MPVRLQGVEVGWRGSRWHLLRWRVLVRPITMSVVILLTVGVVYGAMRCVLLLMLRWEVLAGLGCAVRSHHLAVVLIIWGSSVVWSDRVAVVVLVGSAMWAVVGARSHRNAVVGAVHPSVKSRALRRWRRHFGRRVVPLAWLHEDSLIPLLRNFATLSLAWGGGRGP